MINIQMLGFLLISFLAFQEALGQDAELVSTNDKVSPDGGAQSRTIYSHRQMSPHRMMHFGKRLLSLPNPTILTPRVYDLYQPELQIQQQQPQYQQYKYPYLWSMELERGQSFQALPEELQQNPNQLYNVDRSPSEYSSEQQRLQKQLQQVAKSLNGQRLSKLIIEPVENSANNNLDNLERTQLSSNLPDDAGQQQAISVSARSPQRSNTLNLPKAYISSLYGRQSLGSSSLSSFGSYNKKAEPKDNFFMHFGRK